jgi:hypothetical protein
MYCASAASKCPFFQRKKGVFLKKMKKMLFQKKVIPPKKYKKIKKMPRHQGDRAGVPGQHCGDQ